MEFILVVATFLVLLMIEVPIGFCLGIAGALGIALNLGPDVALATFAGASYESVANYGLSVVPMYILVGMFALRGRIAEHVYTVADRLLDRVRGGLGIATVAACAGFAAVTGSSVATAATIGRLSIGEMRKRGYSSKLATGIVAAAGTLGILIPPSIILVIYGVLTRESIGRLLTAGIIPGIVSAIIYMIYIGSRRSQLPPPRGVEARSARRPIRSLPWRGVARIAVIFAVVMGGVYAGWFTVTESGALGAAFAAVMLVVELRKEGLSVVRGSFASALREAAVTTSMSFFVLIGSSVLTFFLISAGIPTAFTRWIVALDVPGELIVLALLAAMIPLGMFLDSLSIVIIVIPLAYPVVTALGFDGVWFAILFVKMIELGQITPPVGINVYVVSGVSGVKPETVFRGILPFTALDVVIMLIFFTFPQIVLWLPNALLGP